jgi:chromate transporter
MQKSGIALDNILVMLFTVLLLITKKIPAPIIVAAALVAGFVF